MTEHVLIVGFDGLRPDMMSAESTPHLWRFVTEGSRFPGARSVFPSETRVATASLATGCYPSRHGLVANAFFDGALPGMRIDSGDVAGLRALETATEQSVVTAPSLGDAVAAAGRAMVVLSTGTTGSARMLNPRAIPLGHLTFTTAGAHGSSSADAHRAIVERFGPVPEAGKPATARIDYITTVFLEQVVAEGPAASILWFADPDLTSHYRGLGSPDSLRALAGADAAFGRILDWWRDSGADEWTILALSDHGQISVGQRIDLEGAMAEAGFPVGPLVNGHAAMGLAGGGSAGIYLLEPDRALLERTTAWLREQPWCGCLFAAAGDLPGVLPRDVVFNAHPRSPDILFTFRSDEGANPFGIIGGTYHDTGLEAGGGIHGGLHAAEMSILLAAGGSTLRRGFVSSLPAGLVDVAPTALHLLGLPVPAAMQGRPLSEALRKGAPPDVEPRIEECSAEIAGCRQMVRRVRLGRHVYLDEGKRL